MYVIYLLIYGVVPYVPPGTEPKKRIWFLVWLFTKVMFSSTLGFCMVGQGYFRGSTFSSPVGTYRFHNVGKQTEECFTEEVHFIHLFNFFFKRIN